MQNINQIKTILHETIQSKCELGEGVWVNANYAAWVDINSKKIFVYNHKNLRSFDCTYQPSVIYNIDENKMIIGSDVGIITFDLKTKKEELIIDLSEFHKFEKFRSNDGGSCGDYKLLGFMDRESPETNSGFIYLIDNTNIKLIDDEIYIPNTFIEIEPHKLLISDSLTSKIWLYEIALSGELVNKKLWSSLDKNLSPDGGCRIGNYIFIALWDNASIGVFDLQGKLLTKLKLPVIRPTNCKFDKINNHLWVTSAFENLSNKEKSIYPQSGNTLVYNLEIQ